jgi:dUTP pyrophosphatase
MVEEIEVYIKRLPECSDIPLPEYATDGSAGMDIRAAVEETATLNPGERKLIPTGISIALPHGFEVQIRPRSGLAFKHGIMLVNSPGTIDSDYRGEIKIILFNSGKEPLEIKRGDRIAQMVISSYSRAKLIPSDTLPETDRGPGGFGHTGSS